MAEQTTIAQLATTAAIDSSRQAAEAAAATASSAAAAVAAVNPLNVFRFTDPATARPDTEFDIVWDGPSSPIHKREGDYWFRTSAAPVRPVTSPLHALEASAISLGDGAALSTWSDLITPALDFPAPSGKEPSFRVAAGSQPAFVQFTRTSSSVGDCLITASSAQSQPAVLVCVFRLGSLDTTANVNGNRRRIFGGNNASYNLNLDQMGDSSGVPRYRLSNVGQTQFHTAVAEANKWTVAIAQFNASETFLRIDGIENSMTAITSANRSDGWVLGANTTGTANFLDGDIHFFHDYASLPANIRDLEAYLMDLAASWNAA